MSRESAGVGTPSSVAREAGGVGVVAAMVAVAGVGVDPVEAGSAADSQGRSASQRR